MKTKRFFLNALAAALLLSLTTVAEDMPETPGGSNEGAVAPLLDPSGDKPESENAQPVETDGGWPVNLVEVEKTMRVLDPFGEEPVQGGGHDPAALEEEAADNRGPLTLEHELPAAIQFLARMADINIHFDPSVNFTNTPMVSLRWENVTAEDALHEVLDVYGLMLVHNQKTGISRVTQKPLLEPLVTAIVQLRYANPTNMVELVRSSFSEPNRSRVLPDPRTRQLVIVTTERDLHAVTNLIVRLDSPTRQVLIEAHLLETSKNPRSVKGIDWSGTLQEQNFTFGNGITTGQTITETPGTATSTQLPSGRTVSSQPGTSTRTTLATDVGLGGVTANTARGFHPATAFLNADGVRAALSFLNSDNDTEVVATPRAVTADNQTATLEVTRAFPIFEVTPGTAQQPPQAKITYTNVGTILRVTPRIAANNNVAMRVVPEVSNIDSKDVQIINGQRNEANVYAIRRAEADVLIPSGNTLVMGGLISDATSRAFTKVPVLGDLPGIGMAFRRDSKARSKSNLIIFVTPTIVEDGDFQAAASEFLQTPLKKRPDVEESAWNRGRPYDWKAGK
jgi:type IV pilus assembly protein PilQ